MASDQSKREQLDQVRCDSRENGKLECRGEMDDESCSMELVETDEGDFRLKSEDGNPGVCDGVAEHVEART